MNYLPLKVIPIWVIWTTSHQHYTKILSTSKAVVLNLASILSCWRCVVVEWCINVSRVSLSIFKERYVNPEDFIMTNGPPVLGVRSLSELMTCVKSHVRQLAIVVIGRKRGLSFVRCLSRCQEYITTNHYDCKCFIYAHYNSVYMHFVNII